MKLHWFDWCEEESCKICKDIAESDYLSHGLKYNKQNVKIDYKKLDKKKKINN